MARVDGDKRIGFAPKGRFRDIIVRKTRTGLVMSRYDEPSKRQKKKSASQAQLNRREAFKTLQKMANVLKEVNNVGFKREVVYSAHTRFLHHNYSIVDISDDGVMGIDYEQIQLSAGTLRQLKDIDIEGDGRCIKITWSTDKMTRSDGYHQVVVVAYCPSSDDLSIRTNVRFGGTEVVYRKDGETLIEIPNVWSGMEFYIYAFAYTDGSNSRNANASLTQFLGRVEC